ncbi:MAG: 4Fe-4S binding protein [Bacillota bacterium]|jgi:NADH-quinone oxidoreductase subunit F
MTDAKKKKDAVVKLGDQEFTVPAGAKVKDIAASLGIEIPALTINPDSCKGCQLCVKVCETGAITGEKKEVHTLDQSLCIKCGECLAKCKLGSLVPA